jgi:prepilin-type N-terminal cleavage/methylation domain-containing protein
MTRKTAQPAFTLMEMMVVIGVILLLALVVLPSSLSLLRSGSESQAYNLFAGQCSAARAYAMENGVNAMVHVQLADPPGTDAASEKLRGVAYMTIMASGSNSFGSVPAFPLLRMPGTMGMGELSAKFLTTGDNASFDGGSLDTTNKLNDFTTLSVAFSPRGNVIDKINGADLKLNSSDGVFTGGGRLWQAPADEPGVRAVTIFDCTKLEAAVTGSSRAAFLNDYAPYIPLNMHTGQLYPRQ